MKPFDYLLCQIELEGIQRVADDLIARTSSDTNDFPLVLLARTSDGQVLICFDNLLPLDLRNQFSEDALKSFNTELIIEVLKRSGIPAKVSHFKTYIFPDSYEATCADTVKCLSNYLKTL